MQNTDLLMLNIHKLTQEQYDREAANGNLDENAIYLTPDDTYTNDEVDEKINTAISSVQNMEFISSNTIDTICGVSEAPSKVASFDGDISNVVWYADTSDQSIFGTSYSIGNSWLRIDDAWTRDELVGATVVTADNSGEHTFTITEDMVSTLEYEDCSIVRVGINLFGDNDLVSFRAMEGISFSIPSGLYHYADFPITVTKIGVVDSSGGLSPTDNLSIYTAFEKLWANTIVKLDEKANTGYVDSTVSAAIGSAIAASY